MWEEANEYFACNPREKLWLNKNLRARFPCKDSGELFGSQVERHGRPMDGHSSSKFDRRYEKDNRKELTTITL